jgi:hypothetical protein
LPLHTGAENIVREMLTKIASGERVPIAAIGYFTEVQITEINRIRSALSLHKLEHNEILFLGRHLYNSRSKDGYTVDDMVRQIQSGLSQHSIAIVTHTMSAIENTNGRHDGYGNKVYDRVIFEMTSRKPKAELFSIIPKGDTCKPINAKSPPK